jgi:UrcA family protein
MKHPMKHTVKQPMRVHSRSIASIFAGACVAIAYAAGGGSALAQQPTEPETKKVTFGDLDVDSPEGAKALYTRLRSAALQVCSPLESRELSRMIAWQTCVSSALSSAVAQINKPKVTALHIQSTSRPAGNS